MASLNAGEVDPWNGQVLDPSGYVAPGVDGEITLKSSEIIQNQLVNDVVLLKNGRKYGELSPFFF